MSSQPEDETSRPPSSESPSIGEAKVRDEVTGAAASETERPSVEKPRGGSSGAARRLLGFTLLLRLRVVETRFVDEEQVLVVELT